MMLKLIFPNDQIRQVMVAFAPIEKRNNMVTAEIIKKRKNYEKAAPSQLFILCIG